MESSFSPLNAPASGAPSASAPPKTPTHSKKNMNTKLFALLALVVLFVGVVGGYMAISSGLFYKSRASGEITNKPPAQCSDMHMDLLTNDPWKQDPRWFVLKSNANCNAQVWLTLFDRPEGKERPQVQLSVVTARIVNGRGEVRITTPLPCYFQVDLNFGSYQNWESPWMVVDRAKPGELRQGISATNYRGPTPASCTSTPPTATPKPTNTPTPKPSSTVTPKPSSTLTPKPSATVTPKPSSTVTPKPSITNVCPKPNPVKNLRINCPICTGT